MRTSAKPAHSAPWGVSLVVCTAFSLSILVGLPVATLLHTGGRIEPPVAWLFLLPLLFVTFLLAFFMVRGYSVIEGSIVIHRLFSQTRLLLDELDSVEVQPNAMRRSWMMMANGGTFSYVGYFKSRALGEFRAFATHRKRTVVLRYKSPPTYEPDPFFGGGEEPRVVVLSPADPERFVAEVCAAADLNGFD